MRRLSPPTFARASVTCRSAVAGCFVVFIACSMLDAEDASRALAGNSIGMAFVTIPAGDGVVGSPDDEPGRDRDEPRRDVRIASDFFLAKYEVTQQQYQQVIKSNPSAFSATAAFGERVHKVDTSRLPVDSVSWNDAVLFCEKLSALPAERAAGRTYRLPTEIEWEYASRGGRTTIWHFGDDPGDLDEYAWYGRDRAANRPHAVGGKRANPWGLHDMYGNVWEWCGSADDERDLQKGRRVIRGGSWFSTIANCRSATRVFDPEVVRDPDTGFRVVMEIVTPGP